MTSVIPSRIVAASLAVAMVGVLAHTVVAPLYGPHQYDRATVLTAAALAAAFLATASLAAVRVSVVLEEKAVLRRTLVVGFFVALGCVQLVIGLSIRMQVGWDASFVAEIAEGLARGATTAEHRDYVGLYPNNALIVALLHAWDNLALAAGRTDVYPFVLVLNSLAMISAVALTYLAARRIGGPVTGYLTLPLAALFIGLSPWIATAYSDTLTMPWPALVLWLFSIERTQSRIPARAALWTGMGFAAVIGYSLKPTAVFALAAAVLVALVMGCRLGRASWRAMGVCAAATAGGIALAALLVGVVIDIWGLTPSPDATRQQLNTTHFMKMGAQKAPGVHNDYYGAFSGRDVIETRDMPPDERTMRNIELYADRVSEMGPVGYLVFLGHKAAWTWGDGSFFAWGEGTMLRNPSEWFSTDPQSTRIQEWLGPYGSHYNLTYAAWQGTWMIVLLLVAAAGVSKKARLHGPVPTMARLTLLMLGAFLLLFEARARYVFVYLPFVILLASITLTSIADRRRRTAQQGRVEP